MGVESILIISVIVIGLLVAGFYFLNKWATKKSGEQENLIEKNKQTASIYVIDKKHDYAKNINLPKSISENLPRIYKVMKMYFVQAKIGPQIMTLMCEKRIYKNITIKKTIKVELAGIYIVKVIGMKSEEEMKRIKREKKEQEKAEKKAGKTSVLDKVKNIFK